MSVSEDYMLVYASLIVSSYEKAGMESAIKTRNRDGAAIPWLKSMSAMSMILESARKICSGEYGNEETMAAQKINDDPDDSLNFDEEVLGV